MRSLIYGYGDTGKSFERYLKDKKIDFDIFDSNIAEHNQNYNFEDFNQRWIDAMLGIHEKHGSWETRKNYEAWEFIEL